MNELHFIVRTAEKKAEQMNIQTIKIGDLPVLVIDNFFDNNEINLMWNELAFLSDKMQGPEQTYSANELNDPNRPILKKNKGIFIPQVLNPEYSIIMKAHTKLFNPQLKQRFLKESNYFQYLLSDFDYDVLLSRYNEGDYYKPHADTVLMSCITWMYREPKMFTGGDFVIEEHKIELKNNRTVLFPSCLLHAVEPVTMQSNEMLDGRFSLSAFISPRRDS